MEIIFAANHTNSFDIQFCVRLALLHDTKEDTDTTYDKIAQQFSKNVADGVRALSKDKSISKQERLIDCVQRILKQPKEV